MSAVPLALMAYLLWRGSSPSCGGDALASRPPLEVAPRPLPPAAQGAFAPYATEPWFSGAVTVLALAIGVGCLALTFWILFGGRMIGSWEGLRTRPWDS